VKAQAKEGRRIRGVPRPQLPAPKAGFYWQTKGKLDFIEVPLPARKG
jgi:hypothetical protein